MRSSQYSLRLDFRKIVTVFCTVMEENGLEMLTEPFDKMWEEEQILKDPFNKMWEEEQIPKD